MKKDPAALFVFFCCWTDERDELEKKSIEK